MRHFRISKLINIRILPKTIESLKNLEKFEIDYCPIPLLPDVGKLKQLKEIIISYCDQIEIIPGNFSSMRCLEILKIIGCSKLKSLPPKIGLNNMKEIVIEGCVNLDDNFPDLFQNYSLTFLTISGFHKVETLKKLPKHLKTLLISNCKSLTEINPDLIKTMSNLVHFSVGNCNKLQWYKKWISNYICIYILIP